MENDLNLISNSPAIVIFDFDDILVPMSVELYHNIRKNWHIYSRWFVDLGELSDSDINGRSFYSMIDWMIKKRFTLLKPQEYSAIILEIIAMMKKTFFDKDPYTFMEPTKFAKKTLLNPLYIDSENIKHVYILSRNVSEEQDISKRKFIKRVFSNPKISYISVSFDKKKSDAIKENGINFNMIIDDEIPNVRDIIEHIEDLKHREFVLPKFGYNYPMPTELDVLLSAKEATFTYYNA